MNDRRHALLAIQPDRTMTVPEPGDTRFRYGDWYIERSPKPIPDRRFDWDWTHKAYDGPEDSRAGTGSSIEDCIEQIHEVEDD